MKKIGNLEFYTHEEMLDDVLGKKGTARREEHEKGINAFLISEAIKKARLSKNLTQEQLGEIMGVKKAQISRIEKGSNLTISTISKAFRAMGITATLDIAGIGQIEL